ncbi:MAG TPA: BBE domain-containing protein, partial [Polyangiaceae bacterium]|nr:BBE domain-containing protein [Polyangiaceae bacterium]
VVVEFEFELHPCGPDVYSGLIVYPIREAMSVLTRYRSLIETAPDELAVWVVLRKAPPLPFLPATLHGEPIVALAVFYAGDPREGERLAEPFRQLAPLAGDHLGAQPYVEWQQAFDPLLTPGARNYWKSHNFSYLADGLFEAAIQFVGKLPSPHSEVFIGQLGGQAGRVPAGAMAYNHRDANFVMNVHGRWERPEEDPSGIAWARECFEAAAPFATGGVYVNFMPADEKDRVKAAFGGNYDRLAALKHQFDPDNVFHVNQNVRPVAPKPDLAQPTFRAP